MDGLKYLELIHFPNYEIDEPYVVFQQGEVMCTRPLFANKYGLALYNANLDTVRSILKERYDIWRKGYFVELENLLDNAGITYEVVDDSFFATEDVILIDLYRIEPDQAIVKSRRYDELDRYANVKLWIKSDWSNIKTWKTVAVIADSKIELDEHNIIYEVYSVNNYPPELEQEYLLVMTDDGKTTARFINKNEKEYRSNIVKYGYSSVSNLIV